MAIPNQNRIFVEILFASALFGITSDALIRATPWGLNAAICITVLIVCVAVLAYRNAWSSTRDVLFFGPPAMLFGVSLVWRDSPTLAAASCVAAAVLLASGYLRRGATAVVSSSIGDCFVAGVAALTNAMSAGLSVVRHSFSRGGVAGGRGREKAFAAMRGVLISLPLLALFTSLLVSADAAFKSIVSDLLSVSIPEVLVHAVFALAFTWLAAGYLGGLLAPVPAAEPLQGAVTDRPARSRLQLVEVAIPLAFVDLLFAAFVAIQFEYLFGGGTRVQSVAGLTYSEYARTGFFELTAVAALVLPIVLGADWLLSKQEQRGRFVFQVLAGLQVLLVFVILASALTRMRLYQAEYGLTELRVYTTAFMVWLAVIFAWFLATVLRGKRHRFAFGVVLCALLFVGGLVAINPDAVIVRANVERARQGRPFDVSYNTSLSADSVPALVDSIGALTPEDRRKTVDELKRRWSQGPSGWRTWNLDRSKAAQRVAALSLIREAAR